MIHKKKALLAVFCIAALVLGTMAATYAYFTDSEKAVNTFTVGRVKITLDEANVDNKMSGIVRDQENKYHLLPGHKYVKDPTVHVVPNSSDCYVYVTVENQIVDIECDDADYKNIATQMIANNWVLLEDENGQQVLKDNKLVYAHKDRVAQSAVQRDLVVFEEFKVDGEKGTNDSLAKHKDSKIIVNAYAIQAAGFDNALEAWNTASKAFN